MVLARNVSRDIHHFDRPYLQKIGFNVETGKTAEQKIRVPVLFGLNGISEKSFEVDAYHGISKTAIEIEAGRAVTNNQFLKDFFVSASMDLKNLLCSSGCSFQYLRIHLVCNSSNRVS